MSNLLNEAIDEFLDELAPALVALSGGSATNAARDVSFEALNLVTAFIDVDDRWTDDELQAIAADFGPRIPGSLATATPESLRAGFISGRKQFLDKPSDLFDVLVEADRAHRTTIASSYVKSAVNIAHAVFALDLMPSEVELVAIEKFRSMLGDRLLDDRIALHKVSPEPATNPAESLEVVLAELSSLIGLGAVKREVKILTDVLQVEKLRRKHGLPIVERSRHLVFVGNPGTGKTTVARLLARIYKALGVGAKGHLVETDRAGLVAGFVGQTAGKVHKVFESALGGVLLIDEAYTLARGADSDFGREAVDTLVKLMEDKRGEIVVIVAGYPDEMHTFVESNPGLESRFPKTLLFEDYSTDELVQILNSLCTRNSYACDDAALIEVRKFFDSQPRDKGFGNGRLARNLFEAAVATQAGRVLGVADPTSEQLQQLTAADITSAAS